MPIPLTGDRSAHDAENYPDRHANDVDLDTAAIHHTLGTGAEQAAAGDHDHTSGPVPDHDHSGDPGDGAPFDVANLTSGNAPDGYVPTADGAGGVAWEQGGGGAGTFLGLSDTPNSYSGQAKRIVTVNNGANALEFSSSIPADIASSIILFHAGTTTNYPVTNLGIHQALSAAVSGDRIELPTILPGIITTECIIPDGITVVGKGVYNTYINAKISLSSESQVSDLTIRLSGTTGGWLIGLGGPAANQHAYASSLNIEVNNTGSGMATCVYLGNDGSVLDLDDIFCWPQATIETYDIGITNLTNTGRVNISSSYIRGHRPFEISGANRVYVYFVGWDSSNTYINPNINYQTTDRAAITHTHTGGSTLDDHLHNGTPGSGGYLPLTNLTSGGNAYGKRPIATGNGGIAWIDPGNFNLDGDAIHANASDEIHGITEKATALPDDVFLLEDSIDYYSKKRIKASNLPSPDHTHTMAGDGGQFDISNLGSGTAGQNEVVAADGAGGLDWVTMEDANAIHGNLAGEIAGLTNKSIPTDNDILLIEDTAAANTKKKITIGSLPTLSRGPAGIPYVLSGGNQAIAAGAEGWIPVPFNCTITGVMLLADQSGSIVIDIWKNTYANYPPIDANSITAAAPATISSGVKSYDTTLTGWTKTLVAGDILKFHVDSCTTIQQVTINLFVTKT